MKLSYLNHPVETTATTLSAFLAEQGLNPATTLCELNGEALPPGLDRPLAEGDSLLAFSIVAGG